eukprot:2375069-Ditylum_brightwellii.AAC.1
MANLSIPMDNFYKPDGKMSITQGNLTELVNSSGTPGGSIPTDKSFKTFLVGMTSSVPNLWKS